MPISFFHRSASPLALEVRGDTRKWVSNRRGPSSLRTKLAAFLVFDKKMIFGELFVFTFLSFWTVCGFQILQFQFKTTKKKKENGGWEIHAGAWRSPFSGVGRFVGNRPIYTSTGANGPDQYINMLHVRKHTSTSIKFNFPYMNLQNWGLAYTDLISVSQTLRNKSFH